MELIDLEYALQQVEIGEFEHRGVFESDSSHIKDFLNALPTVDAVPVDEIKFHHMLIDKDGIPEIKLQFGERTLFLRRENDPVDVAEVIHGQWIEDYVYAEDPHDRLCYKCSVCGRTEEYRKPYCNCGAKMDGGKNGKL